MSSITASAEKSYALASHFRENYEECRNAFIESAILHPSFTEKHQLLLDVKGPNNKDLSIDIAVLGDLSTATKILMHVSGTHGVEGYAGSAIQHDLLSLKKEIPADTAVIVVHSVNPFGFAYGRRVNEDNIDMNRNFVEGENRPENLIYPKIHGLFCPETNIEFDANAFNLLSAELGVKVCMRGLLEGQYEYPTGLFYGGKDYAQSARSLLDWIKFKFQSLNRDDLQCMSFVIIDVHTGLGEFADDTLLTFEKCTNIAVETLGIDPAKQNTVAGYLPPGLILPGLKGRIEEVIGCPLNNITGVTQEFGTLPFDDVKIALYKENILHHISLRNQEAFTPDGEGATILKAAFNPSSERWRHKIVKRGRSLINKAFELLDKV